MSGYPQNNYRPSNDHRHEALVALSAAENSYVNSLRHHPDPSGQALLQCISHKLDALTYAVLYIGDQLAKGDKAR